MGGGSAQGKEGECQLGVIEGAIGGWKCHKRCDGRGGSVKGRCDGERE